MNGYGPKLSQEPECQLCSRLAARRARIVFPTPCTSGGLLAIGEAPGADKNEIGEGFVGQAGRTLDTLLVRLGLERNHDYGAANVIRCRLLASSRYRLLELPHGAGVFHLAFEQSVPRSWLEPIPACDARKSPKSPWLEPRFLADGFRESL